MSLPLRQKKYQPFGDLLIYFPDHKEYVNYHRELDLNNALSKIQYSVDGVTYMREVLASFPDQVIAVQLTADKQGALSFSVGLDSVHLRKSINTDGNQQTLEVRVEEGVLRGRSVLRVSTDGQLQSRYKSIQVTGASSATLFLGARTSFLNYKELSDRPEKLLGKDSRRMGRLNYEKVHSKHIRDHRQLFDRFNISFGGDSRETLATNERIYQFWEKPERIAR